MSSGNGKLCHSVKYVTEYLLSTLNSIHKSFKKEKEKKSVVYYFVSYNIFIFHLNILFHFVPILRRAYLPSDIVLKITSQSRN